MPRGRVAGRDLGRGVDGRDIAVSRRRLGSGPVEELVDAAIGLGAGTQRVRALRRLGDVLGDTAIRVGDHDGSARGDLAGEEIEGCIAGEHRGAVVGQEPHIGQQRQRIAVTRDDDRWCARCSGDLAAGAGDPVDLHRRELPFGLGGGGLLVGIGRVLTREPERGDQLGAGVLAKAVERRWSWLSPDLPVDVVAEDDVFDAEAATEHASGPVLVGAVDERVLHGRDDVGREWSTRVYRRIEQVRTIEHRIEEVVVHESPAEAVANRPGQEPGAGVSRLRVEPGHGLLDVGRDLVVAGCVAGDAAGPHRCRDRDEGDREPGEEQSLRDGPSASRRIPAHPLGGGTHCGTCEHCDGEGDDCACLVAVSQDLRRRHGVVDVADQAAVGRGIVDGMRADHHDEADREEAAEQQPLSEPAPDEAEQRHRRGEQTCRIRDRRGRVDQALRLRPSGEVPQVDLPEAQAAPGLGPRRRHVDEGRELRLAEILGRHLGGEQQPDGQSRQCGRREHSGPPCPSEDRTPGRGAFRQHGDEDQHRGGDRSEAESCPIDGSEGDHQQHQDGRPPPDVVARDTTPHQQQRPRQHRIADVQTRREQERDAEG